MRKNLKYNERYQQVEIWKIKASKGEVKKISSLTLLAMIW